MAFSR